MRNKKTSRLFQLLALTLFVAGLVACGGDHSRKSAPIGDHEVLEQLATAYRTVGEEYQLQPSSMRPSGRKEFVERVFQAAGYHYESTLFALAKQGVDVTNQDQRDLADLLFLPHRGLSESEMKDLYSADQLNAIRSIQAGLK